MHSLEPFLLGASMPKHRRRWACRLCRMDGSKRTLLARFITSSYVRCAISYTVTAHRRLRTREVLDATE